MPSFYRNRFGDFVIESSGGDTVLTGNRLPVSPDRVINGGAVFSPKSFLDFTLDVKHVGSVQIDQRNTFQLDAYTLVDAAVTWASRAATPDACRAQSLRHRVFLERRHLKR